MTKPIGNLNKDAQRSHGTGYHSDRRWYTWKDEPKRISVTTAIKAGIPAPAITGWAKKMTAIGAIDLHNQISTLLEGEEFVPDGKGKPKGKGGRAVYSLLWGYADSVRDRAADVGTMVHDLLEAHVLGSEVVVPEDDETVAAMYRQGLDFLATTKPDIIAAEAIVHNRTHGYAGTLDAIMRFPQFRILESDKGFNTLIIDYKTGKGVYPEAALQLAALANAEFIGLDDGSEFELPPVDGGAVVHIRPDRWEIIPVDIGPDIFARFVGALNTAEWMMKDSKNALGPPIIGGSA